MENEKSMWQVASGPIGFQVWRQIRPLRPGEPMHSGVRESAGIFDTLEKAQKCADEMNQRKEN